MSNARSANVPMIERRADGILCMLTPSSDDILRARNALVRQKSRAAPVGPRGTNQVNIAIMSAHGRCQPLRRRRIAPITTAPMPNSPNVAGSGITNRTLSMYTVIGVNTFLLM